MKHTLRILGLLLALVITIPSFGAKKLKPEEELKQQVDSLTIELKDIKASTEIQIKELTDRNSELEDSVYDLKRENGKLNDTIAELRYEIAELSTKKPSGKNDLIESYQKKFISIASNFLYLPYDEYSINDLAIPAYETTKGTPLYDKYKIRLQMLQYYARDIQEIIKFLQKTRGSIPKSGSLQNWANGAKKEFAGYPVVIHYQEYGDDWKETYLGKYIVKIFKQLNNLNGDAYSRIYNAFGTYIKELNELLHPDQVVEDFTPTPTPVETLPLETSPLETTPAENSARSNQGNRARSNQETQAHKQQEAQARKQQEAIRKQQEDLKKQEEALKKQQEELNKKQQEVQEQLNNLQFNR